MNIPVFTIAEHPYSQMPRHGSNASVHWQMMNKEDVAYEYINWRVGSTRARRVGVLEMFYGNLSVNLGGGYMSGYMCKIYWTLHFTFCKLNFN